MGVNQAEAIMVSRCILKAKKAITLGVCKFLAAAVVLSLGLGFSARLNPQMPGSLINDARASNLKCEDAIKIYMEELYKQLKIRYGEGIDLRFADIQALSSGQVQYYKSEGFAGEHYVLVGISPANANVDLFVYDGDRNLITAGDTPKNIEIVEHTPKWDGTFFYGVRMTSGSACYGFMVLLVR